MSATPITAADATTEPDLSGRRLGDYQMLRRLGRGGMAEVYLAEQISLRRQVAFKVLKSSLAGDTAYVRRFHHEAQAAANLVHANIVQIHEVGCIDGIHFIAQEYVPGQNLRQLLARLTKGVDARQAANIIRQVAAALHKAAEQNIIHRDIKPENIMISTSGEVKVADFGLARIAQGGEALNLTQVGMTMGTPLYMSPEQVEGKPVDPRSDIYSLGVTCYHMLAGRPPFDGDTALAVALQHLRNEPKRLEAIRPDLPEGLCRVVHKMLAKKSEERYQRAVDLLRDLKGLQIPGLDEDWVSDLPGFTSADLALGAAGRLAATQQLNRVLQSQIKGRPVSRPLPVIVAAIAALLLAGLALGAAIAWINRPQPLLELSESERPKIKKFESAKEQYSYAQMASLDQKEDAWKAVAEYHPPEESPDNMRYSRLAMKGLAAFYLNDNRVPEALPLYEKLAKAESTEREFQLIGLVGQAVCYDRLGNEIKAKESLAQVRPYLDSLPLNLGSTLRDGLNKLMETYPQEGE
ncbi:MAG TPA: protein kinase [Pirellulaceae bacterium]|nr:protein kinase [Pirellulaceae bacterium]